MKRIKCMVNGKNTEIRVYASNRSRTDSDKEMDNRVVAAVREAIRKAKVTNNPIARFDNETKGPYLEYLDGKRVYG